MKIDMVNPEKQILEELKYDVSDRELEKLIVISYAWILRDYLDEVDMFKINKAISKRFGFKGLVRIKDKAWGKSKGICK